MLKLLGYFSLLFGGTIAQFNPIRDPALTIATPIPTIGPIGPVNTIGTIRPIRTIAPIITSSTSSTSSTISVGSTSTSSTSSESALSTPTTAPQNNTERGEETTDLTLVYALVPSGVLLFLLCFAICLVKRKKRDNVVNIDLNIENNIINRQQSAESNGRFSDHLYEEVDYEARYEMPTIGGDTTYVNDGEYGKQVTTIV